MKNLYQLLIITSVRKKNINIKKKFDNCTSCLDRFSSPFSSLDKDK